MIPRYGRALYIAGLTTGQAARLLGWPLSHLSCARNGDIKLTTAEEEQLAKLCDVRLAWLRGEVTPDDEVLRRHGIKWSALRFMSTGDQAKLIESLDAIEHEEAKA